MRGRLLFHFPGPKAGIGGNKKGPVRDLFSAHQPSAGTFTPRDRCAPLLRECSSARYVLQRIDGGVYERERAEVSRGWHRTAFRPSFSDVDDWSRHPLLLRRHLKELDWSGQQATESSLSYDACRASVEREGLATNVPSLADIRGASAQARLSTLRDSSVEDRLLAEQNARVAAQSQADEALAMAAQEKDQRRSMELERDNYKAQLFALRARVEALEGKNSDAFIESQPRPTTYGEFASWVQANFAGKLVLHPRAARAVKDAVYEDIPSLCDAIKILATTYR